MTVKAACRKPHREQPRTRQTSQMKMFTLALTDPKRSEEKHKVLPVHLSPQLQRQVRALSSTNLRRRGPESQLSSLHRCQATELNWTSSDRHPSFLSQRKGSGAPALPVLLWGSNNTETPWEEEEKKNTTHISFPQHLPPQQVCASCELAGPRATDMKWI